MAGKTAMRMRVSDSSGERTIVCGQSDFIKLEREYGISTTALASEMRLEWVAYIAFVRLRKDGATALDFDAWLDTDPEVELLDDDDADNSGNELAPQD